MTHSLPPALSALLRAPVLLAALLIVACGQGPAAEPTRLAADDGRWSADAGKAAPGRAVPQRRGRWMESGDSRKEQDRFINQNLANGDPMMSGEPIGEAVVTTERVGGMTVTRRRQYTGMKARFGNEPARFGEPGFNGR